MDSKYVKMCDKYGGSIQTNEFESLLENVLAGWWDWFIEEDYEYFSPRFKSMLGYKCNEIENKPSSWQNMIHPDDLPNVLDCFSAHVNSHGEIPYHNTVRYYHRDGSIVWIKCDGEVIRWRGDKPTRMIGCHVDVSNIVIAQNKLLDANKILCERLDTFDEDIVELRDIISSIEIE